MCMQNVTRHKMQSCAGCKRTVNLATPPGLQLADRHKNSEARRACKMATTQAGAHRYDKTDRIRREEKRDEERIK